MSLNTSTIKSNLSIKQPPTELKAKDAVLYQWLKRLVDSLNEWITTTATTVNQRPQVGLAADLPPISPGYTGREYFATDTKVLYIDDGQGNWRSVQFT